ncbi:MAG: MoaD/ThiS family protein [Sphingomonadales bacterium]|nr:MoaD/ThiS family protein [Sphingomonadales bacterium]MBD3773389.1 MoaD/ThiS family protein [Paracoccaceae bacterium]
MAIRLVFLGKLADLAGAPQREIATATLGWADLLAGCGAELGGALASEKVRVALNGVIVADKASLKACDGDELALLPPVSGG